MPTAVPVAPVTTSTLRLAVVEFEAPPDDMFDKHGSYGDIVIKLLRRTLASSATDAPLLKATKVCALEDDCSWPSTDEIDAVLVTGSKYTVADDNVWVPSLIEFIQQAYAAKKPLAGICYGHQMIARALGGKTSRNPSGWELSVHEVNFTPTGAVWFGRESLKLHQMHRDAVIEPPPKVHIVASSPGCDVQVMCRPGRVLGFQGHPEFDASITEALLQQRLDEGILETSLYKYAMSRAGREHDGAAFAVVLCRFLGSGVQK